jgi:hypothetical protein
MYFGLFDDKNKLAMLDLDTQQQKRPSTGIYESYILCRDCDNVILSKLETYGKEVLCDSDGVFKDFFKANEIVQSIGLKCARFQVTDYKNFKLFLISILWRMSISSNPFFNDVDLGLRHSEILRAAIFYNKTLNEDDYEVAIIAVQKLPDLIINMISRPRKIRQADNTYYVCLVNGLFFMFNISPVSKSQLISKSRLKANGEMSVPLLEDNLARAFYDSLSNIKIRRNA